VSVLDYVLWEPLSAASFVVGCMVAWLLAPSFELMGASARLKRLRDLRPGHWLALIAALLGAVAVSGFPYRYTGQVPSVWFDLAFVPISAVVPTLLVVAGAGFRPSRRVALILIGVLWTLAAAWMFPAALRDNVGWYRYGLIPFSILDAFADAASPVSEALISVCAGVGIRFLSREMGRGRSPHPVLPVPPDSMEAARLP
jgi:hypothetical protein